MDGREGRRLVSHAEAERFLAKFGYSPEYVHDLLQDLPDPIDSDHAWEILSKHGITKRGLMDRMGGSP